MEIYDYADLKGKCSRHYEVNERTPADDGIKPIFITNNEINMGDLLIINNVAYSVEDMTGTSKKYTTCYVEKLNKQSVFIDNAEPKEYIGTSKLVCPYCGYELERSGMEEEDVIVCPDCHSSFSYQREVRVTYSSRPIKKNAYIKSM